MNLDALRKHCATLPGTTRDIKWGADEAYSVGGKMFAVFWIDKGKARSVSFKCDNERFLELTDQEGIVPAPYLARAHWVQVQDAKEPLNKSRTVATEAWRDGMREARRSEWLIPLREPRDKADRPPSPVPSGCGKTRRLLCCAPRHRRTNYDLRRAPRIHPGFARNAIRVGLIQRFPKALGDPVARELVGRSHALVFSKLTRKQQAEVRASPARDRQAAQ